MSRSFLSVEPQPRVRLEKHSNSLLIRFDTQLQIIADRYLAFFQERRDIEAIYVDSLRELHHKAKTVDASFDPHAEPTTTSAAWDKVRDNLEREAKTQQGLVNILDNDVIKPLVALKISRDPPARYAEHAENRIQKLQQAYLKKYYPQQSADSIEVFQRPQNVPNKWFGLFRGRRENLSEPELVRPLTPSREVSDDDCREAVGHLNTLRVMRAESLEDGYDCLEELVFTPTVQNVLVKYMNGMITTCKNYEELAINTRAEIEKALAGTDTSDLRTSFRRELSGSIPLPTLYRNYRPGAYSDPIFGVPLEEVETNKDRVPKVMSMCIEEVERRGLNTMGIYSVRSVNDSELRRRFEGERQFSFSSADDIHCVAALLELYLLDLPEPLFTLSLQDYRNYGQNKVSRYTGNGLLLLQSKIRGLHPVHRASLQALLRHLWRVSSHSDKNAATVEALAGYLRSALLRGSTVLQDGVHVKGLVLEDLIQHVETLFDSDEQSPPHSLIPSSGMAEATSTYSSAEAQAMGSSTIYPPGLGGIPTSTQSYFSSSPSDSAMGHLTPSQTLSEGAGTTTQEQVVPHWQARGTETTETSPNSTPPGAMPVPSTNVAEWLRQLQVLPHPEPLTIPQSPPENVLYNASDFSHSSATSLRTAMGPFFP
ncbi:hypothetical protein EDB87DRAFT_1622075 [Lactarius vividus]|nr:hypothetical protein EDB87DRAFT_1622075 [Lactarius vividus]